jgi:hypothetical protein
LAAAQVQAAIKSEVAKALRALGLEPPPSPPALRLAHSGVMQSMSEIAN